MQDEIVVGKTCAWSLVPDRALVQESKDGWITMRVGDDGCIVGPRRWIRFEPLWPWGVEWRKSVTIVALEVPADAPAEHLRAVAEHFRACEAAIALLPEVLTCRDVGDLLFISSAVAGAELGRAYPDLIEPWGREAVRSWLLAELVDMTPQEVRMGVERTLGLRALRGQSPAAGGA